LQFLLGKDFLQRANVYALAEEKDGASEGVNRPARNDGFQAS